MRIRITIEYDPDYAPGQPEAEIIAHERHAWRTGGVTLPDFYDADDTAWEGLEFTVEKVRG
jgi:hypothetical protein